jgi:hypothetical protein
MRESESMDFGLRPALPDCGGIVFCATARRLAAMAAC